MEVKTIARKVAWAGVKKEFAKTPKPANGSSYLAAGK
jgi:hypothetical protein